MVSHEQMIKSKLFMRNFSDAFACLEQAAEKDNSLKWYSEAYRMVLAAKSEQEIEYRNAVIVKGPKWTGGRFDKYAKYAEGLKDKYFPNGVESFEQFSQALDKGIKDLTFD